MRQLKFFILIGLSTLLTGCFEIIEELKLNEDGSGKFTMIFNFSQSKTDINTILLLDEIHGYKVPSIQEINLKIERFKDSISQVKGISNVKTDFNDREYILEFSCEFDQVERLNEGIYKLWHYRDKSNARLEDYFRYQNHVFYRNSGTLIEVLYQKMKLTDREVLQGAQYTSVYQFSDEVVAQNNSLAKVSSSKNIVFLRSPIHQLLLNPKLFRNSIKLDQ